MEEATSIVTYLHLLSSYHLLDNYNVLKDKSMDKIKSFLSSEIYHLNIFYRGQPAKYSSIISGLPREAGYEINENSMYEETLNTKFDDFASLDTPLAYLSKMQHYGMPTRLIDFTVNPLIALFFAVQSTNDLEDSIVYIYKNCSVDYMDESAKILSLLPTLKKKSISELKSKALEVFNIDKNETSLSEIASSTVFINYTETLKQSNPRLCNQDGTFAICGNVVDNGELTDNVCSLATNAYLQIRIAHEFKADIKHELDLLFGINDNFIYPELTAWSDYIRKKYMSVKSDINSAYSIVDRNDISLPEIKRLEISLVLNKELTSNQIKACVQDAMKDDQTKYGVIRIYVATNGANYTSGNWIIDAQWVSENTLEIYSFVPFSKLDHNRIYWEYASAPSEREEYIKNEILQSEKDLFLLYHHTFQTLYPHYRSIEYGYELLDFEDFCTEVEKREHFIRGFCEGLSDYGRPRDIDFDRFLLNYIDFVVVLCDITYWVKLKEKNGNWLYYRISRCFSTIRNALNGIDLDKQKWISFYGLNEEELSSLNYMELVKPRLGFKQTLPLSENPLSVDIHLKYAWENEFLIIRGSTNLYEGARLLLTLELRYGAVLFQKDAVVKDNEFEFKINKDVLKYRNYSVMITLSFPRSQDILFLDKAGFEYENLSGDFIDHAGIDSTLRYTSYFIIDEQQRISANNLF